MHIHFPILFTSCFDTSFNSSITILSNDLFQYKINKIFSLHWSDFTCFILCFQSMIRRNRPFCMTSLYRPSMPLRLPRKIRIWRTLLIINTYLKLSVHIPLNDWANILIVKEARNQQVYKQEKSSPTVAEYNQNRNQSFEESQNLAPQSPVNLLINKNNQSF